MVRDETDDETLCAFDSVDATTTRPRARGATPSSVRTTRCDDRDPSTRRANAHSVSPRSLESSHRRMDAVHLATAPRALASSVARPRRRANATTPRLARARRARVGPPRRETRGWREGRERKKERERRDGARERRARTRVRVRDVARREFFLCARRVTRPRRRAGTVARRERECEWCDFELVCSIAIVRRARRCASPPRARL